MPDTDPTRATYLYCVVESPRPPALARGPRGLPGAERPRALEAGGGLWLVVADAPLARYGEAAIARGLRDLAWVAACAAAHEAVIEHAARGGAVVPMRLFTLFAEDARALAHLRARRRRLERVLARTRGRQEWGVRVSLDDGRARPGPRAATAGAARAGAGTAFLLRKKAQRDSARAEALAAVRAADRAFRDLAGRAAAARRRPPPAASAGSILLDAVFLVPAARAAAFRTMVRALARRLRDRGCALTLTGPWPPYNFVENGS
jgi:hypothetical protein